MTTTISWLNGLSGDWSLGADWSGGTSPGAGSIALISVPGIYTVTIDSAQQVGTLTLNNASATLAVSGNTLTVGTLLTVTAGTLALNGGGTIKGGQIKDSGTFVANGGTLSGVKWVGPLEVTSLLTIANGLIVTGANGTGTGTIGVAPEGFGNTAELMLLGAQTIDNATINVSGFANFPFQPSPGVLATKGTVTLGKHLSVAGSGLARISAATDAGSLLINQGTIRGLSEIDGGAFTNQGNLIVQANSELLIDTTSFVNSGTVLVGAGGLLLLGSNGSWSNTGVISDAGGTVTLNGTVTVAELNALAAAGGVTQMAATLDLAGSTLNVGTGATLHTVDLTQGVFQNGSIAQGIIQNGTIHDAGGGLLVRNGTLIDVTYRGSLDLSQGGSLDINAGLKVTGLAGTGAGLVLLTGAGSTLDFQATQTFDAATVDIGSATGAGLGTDFGGQLTLGALVRIVQTGTSAELGGEGAMISSAHIQAAFNGGTFTIGGASFTNNGSIGVSNGDTLIIDVQTLVNPGTLTVAGGGVLSLGGSVTVAELSSFKNTGGTIAIGPGTLDLAASVLNVGAGSTLGTLGLINGTITSGTIHDGGGGLAVSNGGLSGVTYQGALTVGAGAALSITNGLVLETAAGALPGQMTIAGNVAIDSETLDHATISLGGVNADGGVIGGVSTLTLGTSLLVKQTGAFATLFGIDVLNEGTISAGFAHGQLITIGPTFANQGVITVSNGERFTIASAVFTNSGTLSATAGAIVNLATGEWTNTGKISETNAQLILGGSLTLAQIAGITGSGGIVTFEGTLALGGGTLNVGTGSSLSTIGLLRTIGGGTIHDGGNGLGGLSILPGAGPSTPTLDGVTYIGLLNLAPSYSGLTITDGLTLKSLAGGNGQANVTGAGSVLTFDDTQTIDKATINLGNANVADTLAFADIFGGGGTLTLGAGLTIHHVVGHAQIFGARDFGDSILNDGLINAGAQNGSLALYGGAFTNAGSIVVGNGDVFTLQPDALTNLSGTTLTGGNFEVDAGSTLQLGDDAKITTDSANIVLSGIASAIQWLNTTNFTETTLDRTLTSIGKTGALRLLSGRSFSASAAFTDNGTLQLGGGTFAAPSFAVAAGATVIGFGVVTGAVVNSGKIEAQGGALTMSGAVTGSGTLQADSGGTLALNGTASTAASVLNNGTVGLGAARTLHVTGSVNAASTGLFILNSKSLLEVAADTGAGNKMSFVGATGSGLAIDAVAQFGTNVGGTLYTGPLLENFGTMDSIDLKNLLVAGATIDSYTAGSGLLQLHSGGVHATLLFQNSSLGAGSFHTATDGTGHVLLTRS